MYRCRRLLTIILSLAVIASFFVFNASADENSQWTVLYKIIYADGTKSNELSKVIEQGWYYTGGYYGIEITGFEYRMLQAKESENIFFGFRISAYSSNNTSFSFTIPSSTTTHNVTSTNSSNVMIRSMPTGRADDIIASLSGTEWVPSSNTSSWVIRATTTAQGAPSVNTFCKFTLETPYQIKPNVSNLAVWYYFDNIYFNMDSNTQLLYYQQTLPYFTSINSAVVGVNNSLSVVKSTLTDFVNKFNTTYYWTQTEYDSNTGTLTNRQESGDFWNALLGTIKSISSANEQEAALQDKANSKGAGDALDDAYDGVGSSFGKLSDFTDLSDMASWNGSSFSDQAEGGILSWFSQACKDDIDAVPRTREPLDIIDVYSGHIQEYYDALGEDDED